MWQISIKDHSKQGQHACSSAPVIQYSVHIWDHLSWDALIPITNRSCTSHTDACRKGHDRMKMLKTIIMMKLQASRQRVLKCAKSDNMGKCY